MEWSLHQVLLEKNLLYTDVNEADMMNERPPLIGLVRVSTSKQEESGLGLAGQLADIKRYSSSIQGDLVEIYQEVESGKHNDISKRPKLQTAVEHALELDATLVIAKLDRMVRSTSVMEYLKRSKVRFVACDNPYANELTIDILVAVAANEARAISDRTKKALAAYRDGKCLSKRIRMMHPDGVPADVAEACAGKLGAHLPQCRTLTPERRAKGLKRSAESRAARAEEKARVITRLVSSWLKDEPKLNLSCIAARLNAARRKTPRGGTWSAGQVRRVLDRCP